MIHSLPSQTNRGRGDLNLPPSDTPSNRHSLLASEEIQGEKKVSNEENQHQIGNKFHSAHSGHRSFPGKPFLAPASG